MSFKAFLESPDIRKTLHIIHIYTTTSIQVGYRFSSNWKHEAPYTLNLAWFPRRPYSLGGLKSRILITLHSRLHLNASDLLFVVKPKYEGLEIIAQQSTWLPEEESKIYEALRLLPIARAIFAAYEHYHSSLS